MLQYLRKLASQKPTIKQLLKKKILKRRRKYKIQEIWVIDNKITCKICSLKQNKTNRKAPFKKAKSSTHTHTMNTYKW